MTKFITSLALTVFMSSTFAGGSKKSFAGPYHQLGTPVVQLHGTKATLYTYHFEISKKGIASGFCRIVFSNSTTSSGYIQGKIHSWRGSLVFRAILYVTPDDRPPSDDLVYTSFGYLEGGFSVKQSPKVVLTCTLKTRGKPITVKFARR